MTRERFRDRTVLHLQIARTLRSVTQGIAVVDLTLYLKDLHWSGTAIGGVMAAAGFVGAALILMVGFLSDRMGRKPFLLLYEIITTAATLLLAVTENPLALTLTIVITGFGRGQNGAAGPFTPAEQAWMAARVPRSLRGRVFSTNTALGFFGMAVGALLAGTPHLWQKSLPGALSFHPLFALMCVLSVVCAITIATAPSERGLGTSDRRQALARHAAPQRRPTQDGATPDPEPGSIGSSHGADERSTRRRENRDMAKLAAVNVLNGLAIGFMGPMMAYWFALKFGATPAQIGTTLAISFVLTGFSSLLTGSLTQRFGMVKAVVWLRLISVVLLVLLPLCPSFWLASLIYVVRSAFARGTQGARSALSASLTRDKRRGFSVSLNALAMRLPSAVGPTLSGAMIDAGAFAGPFFVAGGLQLASTLLYGRLFRSFDEPLDNANADRQTR